MTTIIVAYCICSGVESNLRPVHNTMHNLALLHVGHASMLLAVQHNARIESNPIHTFPCMCRIHTFVAKKSQETLYFRESLTRPNMTHQYCEPAFMFLHTYANESNIVFQRSALLQ